MTDLDHNKHHPELEPGEVFLANTSADYVFERLELKTKRRGKDAFDIYGRPMGELFPIFVQASELELKRAA